MSFWKRNKKPEEENKKTSSDEYKHDEFDHPFDTEVWKGDNAFAMAKFLKFMMVCLVFIVGMLVMAIKDIYNTKEETLIPLNGSPMVVGSDFVDTNYLINVITMINSHYVSATPATARIQHAVLTPLIHPSVFVEMQKRFDERADKLQSLSSTTLFSYVNWGKNGLQANEQLDHQFSEVSSPVYKVDFEVQRFVFTMSKDPETKMGDVTLTFTVDAGRFWILDIEEDYK